MEGTNVGRFLLELDGVVSIRATECTPPEKTHTVTKLWESNKPNPNLVRGNWEINDVTFKHAYGINNAAGAVFDWLNEFCNGDSVERRNCRLILLDEAGLTPIKTYEMERCVPVNFKPEGLNASGADATMFTFSLRPEDYREA